MKAFEEFEERAIRGNAVRSYFNHWFRVDIRSVSIFAGVFISQPLLAAPPAPAPTASIVDYSNESTSSVLKELESLNRRSRSK